MMISWLHDTHIGGFNTLEWAGILAGAFIAGALALKKLLHLSVSCDIRKTHTTPKPNHVPTGKEKILVMDDDALLRESLQRLLTKLGYQVVCMDTGEKTVSYFQSNGADLVLLDLFMEGGMDGIETYRRIRALRPFQKAIMLSGYADPKHVLAIRNLGVENYLVKPVSLPLLASAIRAELDRP